MEEARLPWEPFWAARLHRCHLPDHRPRVPSDPGSEPGFVVEGLIPASGIGRCVAALAAREASAADRTGCFAQ